MIRLQGGTYHLVLRRIQNQQRHEVHAYERFEKTLSGWESGTRISPIFAVNGASLPSLGSPDPRWMLFLGPLRPDKLRIPPGCSAYISLGLLNVLVIGDDKSAIRRLRDSMTEAAVNWEEWKVCSHRIVSVGFRPANPSGRNRVPAGLLRPLKPTVKSIAPTAREYSALIASAASRASLFAPDYLQDYATFDAHFRELFGEPEIDPVRQLSLLTIANAVLSRHTSQTYAGVSPIFETECHYWTHSLLGIGTASLALRNLVRFVEHEYEEADFDQRISNLANREAPNPPLLARGATDALWQESPLFADTPKPVSRRALADAVPLITCFSGRDGFHSTLLSLSAPLEVLSGCNTSSWTLRTVTHEITHPLIDAVLGELLPKSETEAEEVLGLLKNQASAKNFHDALRAYATFAVWKPGSDEDRISSAAELLTVIDDTLGEAREILTHVCDFLYHYDKSPASYVESLWASWAQIPDIEHRIPAYVMRSVCALHANHLGAPIDQGLAIAEMSECLQATREKYPEAQYIPDAIQYVESNRSLLLKDLRDRANLVKIAACLFFSEEIALHLQQDRTALGKGKVYATKPPRFSDEKVSNPLSFVSRFSRDRSASPLRSIWILQRLAFAGGE